MYHLHKPSVTPPPLPVPFSPLLIIFLSYSWFSIPYLFAYNCYDNRATVCNGNIAIHNVRAITYYIWFTLRFFVGSILQRCKCIRVFHGIYNKPPQVLCQCYQLLSHFNTVYLKKEIGKKKNQFSHLVAKVVNTGFISDASEYAYITR